MSAVLIDCALSAFAVVALDQATKGLAYRQEAWKRSPARRSIAGIRCVTNVRPCLGLLRSRASALVLWTAALVGVLLILSIDSIDARFHNWWTSVGLGAALGGATGNALDYLRKGAIIDFIDLRFWPVFNLADVAIVMGIFVAIWASW